MNRLRTPSFGLFGCIFAVAVAIAALVGLRETQPAFDREHPDYASFAPQFQRVERAFAVGGSRAIIDLAPLNGGAWRTACLFGGYTRPIGRLEALGAAVTKADRDRLAKPVGWRAGPVEETEMLIAFSDEQGRAHFIHFDQGVGPVGQHHEACVVKPETTVTISWDAIVGGKPTLAKPPSP